jgi:hypothetical protein
MILHYIMCLLRSYLVSTFVLLRCRPMQVKTPFVFISTVNLLSKAKLVCNKYSLYTCIANKNSMHNCMNDQMSDCNPFIHLWNYSGISVSHHRLLISNFHILVLHLFLPINPTGLIIFLIYKLLGPKFTNSTTSFLWIIYCLCQTMVSTVIRIFQEIEGIHSGLFF